MEARKKEVEAPRDGEREPCALVIDGRGFAVGVVPDCDDADVIKKRYDSQPDLLQATRGLLGELDFALRRDETGEVDDMVWQILGPIMVRAIEVVAELEGWGDDAREWANGATELSCLSDEDAEALLRRFRPRSPVRRNGND